jgi:hypothetical protein
MWAISTLLGIAVYSGLFLFLLGIKFVRHIADPYGSEIWLVTEVILGTLAVVITLTGVVLIFVDRTFSGRFFFIAIVLGAVLVAWSTAGIISPFKVALGLGRYTWVGLLSGNVVIVLSNIASFFIRIPSLL